MRFTDNRVRGFQVGASGRAGAHINWRAILSYRTSWGTPFEPARNLRHDTSMMIEAAYRPQKLKALTLTAALAFDAGSLYSNNFGAMLCAKYTIPIHKR